MAQTVSQPAVYANGLKHAWYLNWGQCYMLQVICHIHPRKNLEDYDLVT